MTTQKEGEWARRLNELPWQTIHGKWFWVKRSEVTKLVEAMFAEFDLVIPSDLLASIEQVCRTHYANEDDIPTDHLMMLKLKEWLERWRPT